MADSVNPNGSKTGASSEFLPKFYQTDANKKFLTATLDQLTQPGTVKKINGYIGRENAKATTGDDLFISAADKVRQHYQLEPGIVIKDEIGNTTYFKDYIDYINQLGVFGANTSNHRRLNLQEFYSWDPHINWDKIVNFQNYYWIPSGPDSIKIYGQQASIESTYQIKIQPERNNNTYIFSPGGPVQNPTIKLYRGQTYKFEINSPSNPFTIKTGRSSGNNDIYTTGIVYDDTVSTNLNSVETGTITFTVPYTAPDLLFYVSTTDVDLGGVFQIDSIEDNTSINVETDLLGKKTYVLPNGTSLSNGMKVQFIGNVTPESYASGLYYVEGVGDSIQLINETVLQLISPYTTDESVLFDTTPFDSMPFEDASSFAGTPDYIVINRGSNDYNPWSRYNRWFHKDVIEASAKINNTTVSLDQSARAVRPIIEFNKNLKLFNFGVTAIEDIDLVDTFTKDVFSTIEGSLGYNIDNIPVAQGQRILFTADNDIIVKNKIYKVEFLNLNGFRQIHLEPVADPVVGQVVLVKKGNKNQGLMYWYDGAEWKIAQQKTKLNQPPLFDVFDNTRNSFGNTSVYDGSTFSGTKIFSYKVGTGNVDSNLGFALSYKNIANIGDIVFDFNLVTDSFKYKASASTVTQKIDVGYLLNTTDNSHVNGWQKCQATTYQPAIRIYKNSNLTNNFNIDIFDDVNNLNDLVVKVYVNGIRLDSSFWKIITDTDYKKILLNTDIALTDVLTIKAFASQPINDIGYYEIPVNLQNNPLNNNIEYFTLGEVIDHVGSIIDNIPESMEVSEEFSNTQTTTDQTYDPDHENIRDLGNVTPFGTRFVQHSGPASLSLYHITSENNVVRAIEEARDDYGRFKKNFISVADRLGIDTDPVTYVDLILQNLNKDTPVTSPYYFSDMVPYSANLKNSYTVVDYRIKTYPLTNVFSLDNLSTTAVLIYLNETQLLFGKDYSFDTQGFAVISATLQNNDVLTIYEYENTNGSFVPPTPTKLGIWPKYEPMIYEDTALVTPRTMIQGHDGSQILAYGDYRDDIILELEKRIYNNIKVQYNSDIFDIWDIIPGYNRTTQYSLTEFNEVLSPSFYKWTSLVDRDFTKPLSYDRSNSLTFNYKGLASPDGREVPGYWRGVYRWMFDTDRPHSHPWEILGFTIEPTWWTTVYGSAPYTSENKVMWQDIATGTIREPNKPVTTNIKFARPFIIDHIPADADGNLVSPIAAGLAIGIITPSTTGDFVFGDVSPVEAAWRRSSYYPFSILLASMLLHPAKTFGTLLDRSQVVRNLAGQLIYKDTGLRITPSNIILPNIYSSTTKTLTSGIVNYIVDYILSDNLKSYTAYKYELENMSAKLTHRIGGFTSKEKFNLLLDSKTPLSRGSVFVPQEDYDIILNSSSPIKKITYSGIIITKLPDGFEVKGYSRTSPYFKYYAWTQSGITINVGGISESFMIWSTNSRYAAGKIVKFENNFYRTRSLHTTTTEFNPQYYEKLPRLPVVGGVDGILRKAWDRETAITVPYGTKFASIQEVVDFILGYAEYLKDLGFVFNEYSTTQGAMYNWNTSVKEFLFWTTQNWSTGEDKWADWLPNQSFLFGDIVRYNGDYYSAITAISPSDTFDFEKFVKLEGLSTVGSSVISLSPAATKLSFVAPLAVADDIRNAFNGYDIFKVDGTPLIPSFLNSFRDTNSVSYIPTGPDGIFGASFYLVQKEQVIIINNTTMFNDTIYNAESGYRQERIKVAGYVSTNWNGSFDVPGFIFDQASIQLWEQWKDYNLGDIVKYKEFYYSAKTFLPGVELFNNSDWAKLREKPSPSLIPNWNYKATQFADFYSLDSDNFDTNQQQVAQHLIGYQKRQYLSNIIQDDVSEFKFYQGMIIEKGTQNVLNKLFDVLSADGKDSIDFYEEWAFRTGQYGASGAFENIEFALDEAEFKNNPQGFELVNRIDNSIADFIIRKTANDIYVKPVGYNNNPWPIIKNYKPYLRTPGYVRPDQVKLVLSSIDDIVNADITTFVEGDAVWCGFDNNNWAEYKGWNVYRYTDLSIDVTNVTYTASTKELKITTTVSVQLPVGSYIGITQSSPINGFYKIKSISSNSITVSVPSVFTPPDDPFTGQDSIIVLALKSQRAASIDVIDSVVGTSTKPGDYIWTDDIGSNKWGTWNYNPVYSAAEINSTSPILDSARGKGIVLNSTSTLVAITNGAGEIEIYDRASINSRWTERDTIIKPFITIEPFGVPKPNYQGDIIAMSNDGTWLVTGIPLAENVCTNYTGEWVSGTAYALGKIVKYNSLFYQVKQPTIDAATNIVPPSVNVTQWKKILYIPVDSTGQNSTLVAQGVVSIYKKDTNNIFTLVDTIISPSPTTNEKFGSSVVFSGNNLFVGAVGYNNNAGRVYQLSYLTTVMATTTYNPIGSSNNIIKVSNTNGIEVGMKVVGFGFNSSQYVSVVNNSTTLTLNAAPDIEPAGTLQFTTLSWKYANDSGIGTTTQPGNKFGFSLSASTNGTTLAISAPGTTLPGSMFIYTNSTLYPNDFTPLQTVAGIDIRFAEGLAVSGDGVYIASSSVLYDGFKLDQGNVVVYKKTNNRYIQHQTLTNINPETAGFFGTKLAFMNNSKTLVVYSPNADVRNIITFDAGSTTFDDATTDILYSRPDTGRIDIYDQYNVNWVFSESLQNVTDINSEYGAGFGVSANSVVVGAPAFINNGTVAGKIYEYKKAVNSYSWNLVHSEGNKPDIKKIKKAFLYNKLTNQLVSYIDIIDSAQGKIPGIADQEIKYKTFYDPATYSVGTTSVTVDDGLAWASSQVGSLWWDLRNAKFIDSNDGSDVVYRNSTWNTLFPGASIDILEWVSSTFLPADWDAQADTEAGLALGISGQSLYGNAAYSFSQKYDSTSKTKKKTYYYWVKNKKIAPAVPGRTLPAADIASLIGNPRGYGYKYLALTSTNSFSLVNIQPLLEDKDVVLSVEYWITDNIEQNIHSQWKLISTDINSIIPSALEQKWIDSLCGKDIADRVVPDSALPVKLQYGIENRPRQGMFINRFEALKQVIEQVNAVLIKQLITDTRNISNLELVDSAPSSITGLYDTEVDYQVELQYASIGTFRKPAITPIIVDGRIVGINSIEKGNGYLRAPYIDVTGPGTGAKLRAVINSSGKIIDVEIISPGAGYDDTTILSVRNYSILVRSDKLSNNVWSIYSYEPSTALWSRVQSQAYNTTLYWNYVDWFADGINQFTSPDFLINTFADLNNISPAIGKLVKIKTTSASTWLLLQKTNNSSSIDWTQSYTVVGKEKGTIQLSSALYEFSDTIYGYDGALYDGTYFDNSAATELRNILNALKHNILIDDLRQEFLNLFFTSVRYAFTEQTYIDWAFKTSFVTARHNVGNLHQLVTYKNDNLSDYESYITEVKPYRTKVREYISNYANLDTSTSSITDFDLPPVFNNNSLESIFTTSNGKIEANLNAINTYPWKHWLDNVGFVVTELSIIDGGTGYQIAPTVRITSNSGSGATARAFVANGVVNRVVLLTPGNGYLSAPTVELEGGTSGTPARIIAIIGKGVVRSNLIKMKFDRTTQTYFISSLQETDTLVGTGSQLQFPLTWAPDVRIGKTAVTSKAPSSSYTVDVLRDTYMLSIKKSTTRGYTSYSGLITFETAPAKGAIITVSYLKDWSILNAADRIQFYYDPKTGGLGKDLAQLMTGIDYGGVVVSGIGFDIATGWDSLPYLADKWAINDTEFDDYIATVSANTYEFELPYTPAPTDDLNVYHAVFDTDTPVITNKSFTYNAQYINPSVNVSTEVSTVGIVSEFVRASLVTSVIASEASGRDITVDSTVAFIDWMPISFSRTFAGLAAGVTFYVLPQFSSFKFSVSATVGGLAIELLTTTDQAVVVNIPRYLVLDDTTGIEEGMSIIGTGFAINPTPGSRQVVKNIINSTVVTISAAPNNTPAGNLYFTKNVNLLSILHVTSTAGLKVGDVLSIAPNIPDAIQLSTTITEIIDATRVQLNQLIIKDIVPNLTLLSPTPPTATFSRTLKLLLDYTIPKSGTMVLTLPLHPNNELTVSSLLSPVRVDSDILLPIVTDNLVDITPLGITVNSGDQIIIRKSTSDGSIKPSELDYDTSLTGGTFAYNSATGFAPDEIIIDGDDFVSPTTSPAPEEVVPGQVVDAVAIKVFDKASAGSAAIRVDSYTADGTNREFKITQTPNSVWAVVVKTTEGYRDPTTQLLSSVSSIKTEKFSAIESGDYSIDYPAGTIKFDTAPAEGLLVSIFSIGFSGSNILDLDYFIGDSTTYEFITKAPWVDNVTSLVYIDGIPVSPQLFKTDDTYDTPNKIGLRFVIPPFTDEIINYIIVSGTQQTFAITKTQKIAPTGTNTYDLIYDVGDALPAESNMLVRVDQTFLKGPNNSYFKIAGTKVNYTIDPTKFLPYSVSINNIVVLAAGKLLELGKDYTIDLSGITVKINELVRKANLNQQLVISIATGNEYQYIPRTNTTPPRIVFAQEYDEPTYIEITSSYKHDILDIQRTAITVTSNLSITPDTAEYYNYLGVSGGYIPLDRTVIDDNYVWVLKNGTLLTPSVDFKLNTDKTSITLALPPNQTDEFTFITYGSNVLSAGVSYMQFKDILNRIHFKRLSANKQTQLAEPLHFLDTTITLLDATNFDIPNPSKNKPGVIEIRGERIEYFAINENVLSQIRRGTLGTGTPTVHPADSYVLDIGASQTIPYTDSFITDRIVIDATSETFVKSSNITPTALSINPWFTEFGYSLPLGRYSSTTQYLINDVVEFNNYYYVNTVQYTIEIDPVTNLPIPSSITDPSTSNKWMQIGSIPADYSQADDIEVFVGGTRLKKKPFKTYSPTEYPESPEGDVFHEAEFSVNGTNIIRLTNPVVPGTVVTVVKRTGLDWDGKTTPNILIDDGKIANFLKATPGIWHTNIQKSE